MNRYRQAGTVRQIDRRTVRLSQSGLKDGEALHACIQSQNSYMHAHLQTCIHAYCRDMSQHVEIYVGAHREIDAHIRTRTHTHTPTHTHTHKDTYKYRAVDIMWMHGRRN